jgi:hypothetical protein
MTTEPLLWMTGAYFLEFVAVIYFTRATSRRVVGALSGGGSVGVMLLGMIALCQDLGWWRIPFASTPSLTALLGVGLVISCSPIYLVTWRIARRFGRRGFAVFLGVVTVIGPPRDYLIAAKFPQWMVFSPGVAPILADAVAYVGIVVVGHGIMRLVAGPAAADRFARNTSKGSNAPPNEMS